MFGAGVLLGTASGSHTGHSRTGGISYISCHSAGKQCANLGSISSWLGEAWYAAG